MRAYRSNILGALLALTCIPGIDTLARMEERLRETLMSAIVKWTPDLAPEATLELLLADVKATALLGPSHEQAADALVDLLREWANNGRARIVLRDEAVAGEWRVRLLFDGPGNYQTELYKRPGERWATYLVPTRAQAWDLAVKEAKERALAARPIEPVRGFPLPPPQDVEARALSLVIDDMPTFHGRPLARRLPDGSITSTRPTIDEARRDPDAFARYVMSDQHPAMAYRAPGPVDFKRAGEESRARRTILAAAERIDAFLHSAGKCTCGGGGTGDCDWCVMDRRRAAREDRPAKRDEQAADRKARARKKARRGW